ncbi:unnamed protein product [Amoebophrya sp. A25]|nr:unnamed protein product [Amoebophrya sp. A25]CAD7976954.1 unnamed protein product [Amoebophrya sp. A25]|eukprot:GSA25T00027763001.1
MIRRMRSRNDGSSVLEPWNLRTKAVLLLFLSGWAYAHQDKHLLALFNEGLYCYDQTLRAGYMWVK